MKIEKQLMESKGVYQDALRCNRDAVRKSRVWVFVAGSGVSERLTMVRLILEVVVNHGLC
ncbi:hypothetical protein Hanom_Chr03g00224901 [Helianthus anomalus]